MEKDPIHILIVDDDPGILKSMSRSLGRRGYRTQTADCGNAALEMISSGGVDLVLLDQNMPGLSGMETLEQMHIRFKDAPPAIMVTAADSRHLAVEFMKKEGAADFIAKPIQQDMLDVQIRAALKTKKIRDARDRERVARLAAEAEGRMKDNFMATMSHEFHTPMNAVSGFAQLVLKKLGDSADDDIKGYITEIQRAANQMADLVNDLLRASETQGDTMVTPVPFSMAGLVRELPPQIWKKADDAALTIEKDIPEDLPKVWADPEKLGQVMEYILDNAVKFTPEGHIRLAARAKGDRICIEVSDTGIGIPETRHRDVFDRFYRLDRSGSFPGLGIGLYLTKFWISRMDGIIRVESRPAQGTVFQIDLPCAPHSSGTTGEAK